MSAPPVTRSPVSPSSETITSYHLTDGPRAYRARIRAWGALVGLVIPGLVGGSAYFVLQVGESAWTGAYGLIGGYLGAPALLAVSAPFGDRALYPLAAIASGLMWMLIGFLAARRATRNPMASWADYWRHYLWMLAGIWVGAGVGLAIATVRIGTGVLDW